MYRTEAFSGQMIYDVCEVIRFETFELGNSDILETILMKGFIKDQNLHNLAWMIAETTDVYRRSEFMSKDEERDFVRNLVEAVSSSTGIDLKYCLWLAPKKALSDFYGLDMIDEFDYEAYEVGPVVLSDLEDMGKLFGYAEYPSPLAPDDYPGGVKKPIKLSKKLRERKKEFDELRMPRKEAVLQC